MIKSDIVKKYLENHPATPTTTMARELVGKYPGLWSSVTDCRSSVRYYRGSMGKTNRKHRMGKKAYPKIPKSDSRGARTRHLKDIGKWLVLSDIHFPYHDEKALDAAIKHGVDSGCEHLLLNGDGLDAYQQSRWVKDPNKRSTESEIAGFGKFLQSLDKYFPGHKVYKIGNHEARIEDYLFMNAPRMIGMSKWNLGKVLGQELGISWEFIGSKQLYKLGKLNGYHGHELPRGLTNPVSVGRGVWLRTKQTGFTSHWHSTSCHIETSGDKRKTWVCFSVGCLCNLHPDYAPINKWNHGAAIVELGQNGNFNEDNFRIHEGKVW